MSLIERYMTEEEMNGLLEAARLMAASSNGGFSEAEKLWLSRWSVKDVRHGEWLNLLRDPEYLEALRSQHARSQQIAKDELTRILSLSKRPNDTTRIHKVPLYKRWWAAASIILLMAIGTYVWIEQQPDSSSLVKNQTAVNIVPGREGAILTLADGRQVMLDSANSGLIATQNGTNLLLEKGRLAYDGTGLATSSVLYNKIVTSKGRQFMVALPDGTRVWLNAESSIHYPTVFSGPERKITVSGEVYLEVANNKAKPFIVAANDMEVQVLGTRFNINAYSDEPAMKTTLLDGSIKIFQQTMPEKAIVLKPGEQAVLKEKLNINRSVDLEKTIAWKNGVFNFEGATLEEFMRQIARWYDVDIQYEGAIPERVFKGKMGRDLHFSQVTALLTQLRIKYRQAGKIIIIESQ